jgi:hypothetical protein
VDTSRNKFPLGGGSYGGPELKLRCSASSWSTLSRHRRRWKVFVDVHSKRPNQLGVLRDHVETLMPEPPRRGAAAAFASRLFLPGRFRAIQRQVRWTRWRRRAFQKDSSRDKDSGVNIDYFVTHARFGLLRHHLIGPPPTGEPVNFQSVMNIRAQTPRQRCRISLPSTTIRLPCALACLRPHLQALVR